ncbi:DUF6286 domain-containing protein [Streptomyces sp. NPDC059680]|uniref:DUF6286 domain-containing protein n=1 Tax=Streptomyces sp. NPDC059680 TaxID=3346904 RepID=UPI0036A6CC7B
MRRIAERAAAEALAPGDAGAVSAKVATGGGRAELTVELTLPYRASLEESGDQVQRHVAARTAALTGLRISLPRIRVRSLTLRAGLGADGLTKRTMLPAGQDMTGGTARRMWSERRLPAALTALLGTAVCAVALREVVSVHVGDGVVLSWRPGPLAWPGSRGPGNSTLAVAAVTILLGLGLILLAVTPGRRRSLPMRSADRGMHAALNRAAAEALVRDAVSDVSGISHVRVRVGRRKARIRAVVRFGDSDTAHEAVMAAAHEALAACGLRRTFRLRVRVRIAPGSQPTEHEDGAAGSDVP